MERERFSQQVAEFTAFIGATPQTQLDKFKEEITEAVLEEDKTSKEFAMELTDTVIVALGIIASIGFNFPDLFDEKMAINWKKYAEMPKLKAKGLDHGDASKIIKDRWAEQL